MQLILILFLVGGMFAAEPKPADPPKIDLRLQLQLRTVERDISDLQLTLNRASVALSELQKQIQISCGEKHRAVENPRTREWECVAKTPEK